VLRAYGATDKGRVRPVNEDCWAFEAAQGLCVVADGLGGHNAGEVAARVAVETVVTFLTTRTSDNDWPFGYDPDLSAAGNRVRTAIQLAHMQVLETAITSQRYSGMGTTIVASIVEGNQLSVGHVGDSRLYVLANDRLRQLTRDDSWVASVLAHNPSVDVAHLEQHPMRNALTNVVGSRRRTDVHVVEESLQGGELLLLTTDGVHGVLDEARLEQVILDSSDVQDTAANLVAAALARGSRDNCTALVARYLPE
jgi:PPM family protein phosphatase